MNLHLIITIILTLLVCYLVIRIDAVIKTNTFIKDYLKTVTKDQNDIWQTLGAMGGLPKVLPTPEDFPSSRKQADETEEELNNE